jgi:hypothetical protein
MILLRELGVFIGLHIGTSEMPAFAAGWHAAPANTCEIRVRSSREVPVETLCKANRGHRIDKLLSKMCSSPSLLHAPKQWKCGVCPLD